MQVLILNGSKRTPSIGQKSKTCPIKNSVTVKNVIGFLLYAQKFLKQETSEKSKPKVEIMKRMLLNKKKQILMDIWNKEKIDRVTCSTASKLSCGS